MSGPYPPPGYPHQPPEQGGWWNGRQGPNQTGPHGPYGGPPGNPGSPPGPMSPPPAGVNPPGGPPGTGPFEVTDHFPAVQYSGLGGQPGGWGEQPPKRRRNTGRIIVAVVSVLVIIGGVATGIVLLNARHDNQPQASSSTSQNVAPPVGTSQQPTTAPTTGGTTDTTGNSDTNDPGVPNGSTTLTLTAGACVTAQLTSDQQYTAVHQVTCGTAQSDLILAMTSPDMAGCAEHQYLRLSAPNAGVDCFTLDIKQGDCVDNSYLKTPCTTAQFTVSRTEPGPGSGSSCSDAPGSTHWVPVGRNPVQVGCLAPTKKP